MNKVSEKRRRELSVQLQQCASWLTSICEELDVSIHLDCNTGMYSNKCLINAFLHDEQKRRWGTVSSIHVTTEDLEDFLLKEPEWKEKPYGV